MSRTEVLITSRPFFSAKEIASFERTLLTNPAATEHDASDFFARNPTFLHMGQGGEIRREVAIGGTGSAYRVDFFRKSFGRKHFDILELKRPTYSVVASESGNHPRLSAVANAAISQALDYRDLLISNADHRARLAQSQIHVLRPKLTIILGQDPEEIDPDQFEILLDRVRSMGPIELWTYTGLHRFAVEHYEATGLMILPSHHLSLPSLDAISRDTDQHDLPGAQFSTYDLEVIAARTGRTDEKVSQDTAFNPTPTEVIRLFVGNVPFRIEEPELREVFQESGQVFDLFWPIDRETGRKKGFLYVDVPQSDAERVIEAMNNREVLGRPLAVNYPRPREER